MSSTGQHRYILVYRKTRLQELVERFNTWPQARFYLEHNNVEVKDYLVEHDLYQLQLNEAEKQLKQRGRFQLLERGLLPSYRFGPADIIVTIGQDGLVANTLKYLDGQPVIAINPDPDRWDGKLLPFNIGNLSSAIQSVETQNANIKSITFAEVTTNDGQRLLAVNDLFIGPKSHTSARYTLKWGGQTEEQSSSGIIISTGLGSTGWLQSILAGAQGILKGPQHSLKDGFDWSDAHLQFVVREPFPSHTTGTDLVFGKISNSNKMVIESSMPENGVIFSDGIEQDYLYFNSGCVVTVFVSKQSGALVVS